jgi:hypothetical protein
VDELPASTDGKDRYWFRARIVAVPTTNPVFEQFQGIPSVSELSSAGVILHGKARARVSELVLLTSLDAPKDDKPADQDLAYSTNVLIGTKKNEFEDLEVQQIGFVFPIPFNWDMSSQVKLEFNWQATANTGNVEWEMLYGMATLDDLIAVALPGGLDEFALAAVEAVPGTITEGKSTEFLLQLPQANPDDRDSIFVLLIRDATVGNADDTLVGSAILRPVIALSGLAWRLGQTGS